MRFFSRLVSTVAIRIEGGQVTIVKGRTRDSGLRDVAAVCRDAGVSEGEIWVNGAKRVKFSSGIPENIQQRLRNCVLDGIYQ